MWKALGEAILRYKIILLLLLLGATAFMGWHASKVKLSYEFSRAIPTDNPKYKAYQQFRSKYGEDGNLLVIGIQTKDIFQRSIFNDYLKLHEDLKKTAGVDDVISMPAAVNLIKDSATEKLEAKQIFIGTALSQSQIDSSKAIFYSLPFYRNLLYNRETNAWLMGVRINKNILNSEKRTGVVD
jgi:predicted RND superfamily exporter protein